MCTHSPEPQKSNLKPEIYKAPLEYTQYIQYHIAYHGRLI